MWLATVVAASVAAATAAPAALASPRRTATAVSSNWAGYAVSAADVSDEAGAVATAATPVTFTDVTGTWVEPTVSCAFGSTSSAAFWVGLGGLASSSNALEQIGTEVDCSQSGAATHSAWLELVPAPAVPLKLKVSAGDTITATVLVNGADVTLQITNVTRHVRITRHATVAAPDLASAEWIAEAPSVCSSGGRCRTVALSNFGTVSFTRAAVVGNGHTGTIPDPTWVATPIALDSTGSGSRTSHWFGGPDAPAGEGAAPGQLGADGRSFAVSWQAQAAAPQQ